ncbi:Uncharacterised protein (plasmid) [Tsukamurella tyrosinosolvens]|uniref:MinD-like ATPase involved in chromosome partitioning or flagellar assembly n=1 Tax=Tsukamurella tyrosinosolvens TaxID=57704 RepID=A0A1H4VTB4_TSUTY|nr:hypothetical protein [Tsukamurella tyrosinosolvens]KXO90615.1 hypothetical protein AXK58_22865 [Tsukamurella tyrosinosolvens]SEC84306.1 MinD-like ATPase involved in chromosome partitioning or flagellar assembly [Tsukamurella tyrosinosolvens]VEH90305.1 Uncharacterised protein [Tsukamurella tyrosinosolvens]
MDPSNGIDPEALQRVAAKYGAPAEAFAAAPQAPHRPPNAPPEHGFAAPPPMPSNQPPAQHQQQFVPTDNGAQNTAPERNSAPAPRVGRVGVSAERPKMGWQAKLNRYGFSFSKGDDELDYDRRVSQVQRNLRSTKTIMIISGKGSATKTATTVGLGDTLVTHRRGSKVVAMSIDPTGDLTSRIVPANDAAPRSVFSLAADKEITTPEDVGSYLMTSQSGLFVLGSSPDDHSPFLDVPSLRRSHHLLRYKYGANIILIDAGGNHDSATFYAGLELADQLVFVAEMTPRSIAQLDEAADIIRRAPGKYPDLVRKSAVVLTTARLGKSFVDGTAERDRIKTEHGDAPVIHVPYDRHIAEDGPIYRDMLQEATRRRYLTAAAEVLSRMSID